MNKSPSEIFEAAHAAGMKAAAACVPNAMVVIGAGGERYAIADGACGFAWIVIKPANSAFANWMKKNGKASKHYAGGVSWWVGEFNQSMEKKEAYAYAAAAVLREAGIKAYSESRMD